MLRRAASSEIVNPATGEVIAEVPKGTEADVDRAVQAAKQAYPEWRESTPGERAEVLLKLADVIDENTDELAQIESQNVGKPLRVRRGRDARLLRQHPLLRGRCAPAGRHARQASTCAATRR